MIDKGVNVKQTSLTAGGNEASKFWMIGGKHFHDKGY